MAEYNSKLLDLMCSKVVELEAENKQLKEELSNKNRPRKGPTT